MWGRSDPKTIKQSEEEARFDRSRRELVFEARGAAGDRTRTAEELAELERLRLEVLLPALRTWTTVQRRLKQ